VKHQTTSEATPVPPSAQAPTSDSRDTATLELLARWRREDSNPTLDQIRVAEEELREFKRMMNENRSSAGEPTLYP
jgi:hypothetical protein